MLKITRAANGEVVLTVSGRLEAQNLAEMERTLGAEAGGRVVILDLKDLTHVDQDAVRFLGRCEVDNIQLNNCRAYIREWITRERDQR
jgi:anti-anti-sigma regulatory factor